MDANGCQGKQFLPQCFVSKNFGETEIIIFIYKSITILIDFLVNLPEI